MGKYMKKTKITGEVAVMDVAAHQSLLGVRTRARTLALQRLQKPVLPLPAEEEEEVEVEEDAEAPSSSSYLQLRSRRLEKPIPPPPKSKDSNPNPRSRANSGSSSCRDDPSLDLDAAVEVSFGDNVLEAEARDRNARETTPCSLIRNSESIRTPGSTTRQTNSTASSRRIQCSTHQNLPTTHEMEEFFSGAEQMQQRMFAEKYNFDPVNDLPLPGRFEWVKLNF